MIFAMDTMEKGFMNNIVTFFKNIKKYNKYAVRSAKAELKSEVSDSYLNWLWWILEPVCFMLIYTFVFGVVFHNDTPFFASFVLVGLTVWDFFSRMVTGSVRLIINNRGLVTKVYIPKYVLLLSKSYTYLFKAFISLSIALCLMIIQGVHFSYHVIYVIPILMTMYVFTFGVSLLLMHFGVLLNDLANLTRIGLKMVFYLSGVFYSITDRLSGVLCHILLNWNPVAFLMNELRNAFLYNVNPNFIGLALWFTAGLILCVIGINIIHKNENSYAKAI